MFPGLDFEYFAHAEMQYRQTVLYPALAQRALHQRELRRPTWRQVAGWQLGTAFVRLGEQLRATASDGMAPSH